MKRLRAFLHLRAASARWASWLLSFGLTLFFCVSAGADEGGVPFWLSGQYSSLAAVPPQPGWSMPTQLYYWNGDASGTKNFQRGDAVNLGVSSQVAIIVAPPPESADQKETPLESSFRERLVEPGRIRTAGSLEKTLEGLPAFFGGTNFTLTNQSVV
jgi:hypothetical protein